jgi:hypothetical protein
MTVVLGAVLEGPCRMPFHTDLQTVFRAIGEREKEFDWLVTDLDCDTFPVVFQGGNSAWVLPGHTFADVVSRETTPIRFNWGTFSGVGGGVKIDLAHLADLPYADGNAALWSGPPAIQYRGAAVEIVCWNARATLLLTTDEDLYRRFRAYFPESLGLEERNRARSGPPDRSPDRLLRDAGSRPVME